MLCLPFELIILIIEELYHIDRKSVGTMCLIWPHATRFIQETVFQSIKLIADGYQGPGAHMDDLLAKPPHITRLVHHLSIQSSEDSADLGGGPMVLPIPTADFFSRLPNLTSLYLSFLPFSAAEDLPSLLTTLSRCPISSLKLLQCELRLSEMNALLHHLLSRLRCFELDGIFIDELLCYAIHYDPPVVDFDDGKAGVHVNNPANRAYIHLDELCLYARMGIIDVLNLYSSRKFSPACPYPQARHQI
ncbi:hypothetical protein CPB85DRAFT_1366199 [Mucidula mucida]|nr:hypothetical protein CPB85DRAFT_1366199 [Mucidula mucida]